jgi:hypothetical protein
MVDESRVSYAIMRHNSKHPEQTTVAEVVRGLGTAQRAVDRYAGKLTKDERDAGWDYFLQETTLKPRAPPKARRSLKPGWSKPAI